MKDPQGMTVGAHWACQQREQDLRIEVRQLLAALARLVELGEDDGSAPSDAWKQAFEQGARIVALESAS